MYFSNLHITLCLYLHHLYAWSIFNCDVSNECKHCYCVTFSECLHENFKAQCDIIHKNFRFCIHCLQVWVVKGACGDSFTFWQESAFCDILDDLSQSVLSWIEELIYGQFVRNLHVLEPKLHRSNFKVILSHATKSIIRKKKFIRMTEINCVIIQDGRCLNLDGGTHHVVW